MAIIIKTKTLDANHEWAIIELQGDLQYKRGISLENKCIGDFHYTKDGVPTLILGSHLLSGKEVDMPKPLILLEKKQETEAEYSVKYFIKKKIIFRTRPKPLVSIDVQNLL